MSSNIQIAVTIMSLLLSGGSFVVLIATFFRGGGWAALKSARDLASTLAQHDARLKAVEARVSELPTAQQMTKLTGSIDLLEAKISGQLSTIAAEQRHADESRKTLQIRVDRIHDHLMGSKAG